MGYEQSSSDEEDSQWKAAIQSIAAASSLSLNLKDNSIKNDINDKNGDANGRKDSQKMKHFQLKARKILDDLVENGIEIVRDYPVISEHDDLGSDAGVRLFKDSPAGIVFDHRDEIEGPKKRPNILPRRVTEEKSPKWKRKIKAVVVDGDRVIESARIAAENSLCRMRAKDAVKKEKCEREEERIANLKKIRGERWLPSIAKEKQKQVLLKS